MQIGLGLGLTLQRGGGAAPEPEVTSHRYWRILIAENNGGITASFAQLHLHETAWGPNIATGGTAISDGDFQETFLAEYAFSAELWGDNTLEPWVNWGGNNTSGVGPWWIGYDFGAGNEKAIKAITIVNRSVAANAAITAPRDFAVQWSDNGTDWTTAWEVADQTFAEYEVKRFIDPAAVESYTGSPHGSRKFWRLWLEGGSGGFCGFAEAQLRAVPSGASQATGGTASASSAFEANPASGAFDGNAATNWFATSNNREWLQYEAATTFAVSQVALQERASGTSRMPQRALLAYRDSTSEPWTAVASLVGITSPGLGNFVTFTDPNYITP